MSKSTQQQPAVCKSARTVGILKPVFNPHQGGFLPPELRVYGTGFWLKNDRVFIT